MSLVRRLTPELFVVELALTADAVLVDVRTAKEIESKGSIDPDALNLDYLDHNFEQKLAELDKHQPFFLHCQNGKRGPLAARLMLRQGFRQVAYLEGGKAAWDKSSL